MKQDQTSANDAITENFVNTQDADTALSTSTSIHASQKQTEDQTKDQTKNQYLDSDLSRDQKPEIAGTTFHEDESSNLPEEGEKKKSSNPLPKSRTWLKWIVGLGALLIVLGAILLGVYYYDLYKKKSEITELLPGGAHIVMKIQINADAAQYTHLENVMERIPGYHLFKKRIDKTGSGKTLSEHVRETIRSYNLDYDDDIKTVLGDEAIVVLPDILELSRNLRDRVPFLPNQITTITSDEQKQSFLSRFLTTTEAFTIPSDSLSTDLDSGAEPPLEADFLMSAQIIDLDQAKNVLKKMQSDEARYTVDKKKAHGLPYVRLQEKIDGQNSLIGIGDMYHTIIGGHWIISNNEQLMTDTLARKSALGWFAFLSKKPSQDALRNDDTFNSVDSVLESKDASNLFSVFVNVNMKELSDALTHGDNQNTLSEYFNYPERYIAGFAVEVDEKGFVMRSVTEDTSVANQDFTNTPISEGLTQKIPANLNEKFGDFYIEYDNIKDLYYSFKNNGLTPKGIQKLNEVRDDIATEIGIDYETDIIDQIAGGVASVLFARSGQAPEGAILMEVVDPERMRLSMEKAIEVFKESTIEKVRSDAEFCKEYNELLINQESEYDQFSDQSFFAPQECPDVEQQVQAIRDSSIVETQTGAGTIYSYKSPENTDISFDFGFQDSIMIAATNFATVESVFVAMEKTAGTFATQEDFLQAFEGLEQEGYVVQYVKLLGVWNSIQYVFDYFTKQEELPGEGEDSTQSETATDAEMFDQPIDPEIQAFQQEIKQRGQDIRFLIGAYMRVIDTIASISKGEQGNENISGNTRIQITDISPEDLQRANAILDGF